MSNTIEYKVLAIFFFILFLISINNLQLNIIFFLCMIFYINLLIIQNQNNLIKRYNQENQASLDYLIKLIKRK